jgi:large subunit ribosomal protein L30
MEKVLVTLVKSPIDRSHRQKSTIKALGLNKLNSSAEHNLTPQLQGMISKVNHLLKVEKL